MKIIGEITQQKSTGDTMLITLENVKRRNAAGWHPYGPPITFDIPFGQARNYTVGRSVEITIKAK